MRLCDCERSHNGFGMVGRECDCEDQQEAALLKIKSAFAILDVESGRRRLEKLMKKRRCVKVTVTGWIEDVHGSDDGTSQEFQIKVEQVNVLEVKDQK